MCIKPKYMLLLDFKSLDLKFPSLSLLIVAVLLLFQSRTSCFSGVLWPSQKHKRRIHLSITDRYHTSPRLSEPSNMCGRSLDWSCWIKDCCFLSRGTLDKIIIRLFGGKTLRVEQVLFSSKSTRTVFVTWCIRFLNLFGYSFRRTAITWGVNPFRCLSRGHSWSIHGSCTMAVS